MRLAVVVSFLDEAAYLPSLLDSLAAQERRPDELVLVDDGSVDRSAKCAEQFCATNVWAKLLRRSARPPTRDRLAGAAELRSFHWAVERLDESWDVLGKIDADMLLTPATLASVMDRFKRDARLGMCGPFIAEPRADGRLQRRPSGPGHVEGSTKFYRRACFSQISPIPEILGWDVIDETRARMRGWKTESFSAPDGDPLHTRPMGDHDGRLRAFRRWGLCGYAYGAHPLHVMAYGGRLMADEPYVAGGLNYLAGYAWAAVRRVPRAEPELRRVVGREQLAPHSQARWPASRTGRRKWSLASRGVRRSWSPLAGSLAVVIGLLVAKDPVIAVGLVGAVAVAVVAFCAPVAEPGPDPPIDGDRPLRFGESI